MRSRTIPLLVALALGSAACHKPAWMGGSPRATAVMRDGSGASLGVLRLEPAAGGVRIVGNLAGLPPGTHGIHFHQVGRCDTPGFTTAGAHFNPASRKHGLENPAGPHAGDLPNLVVDQSGRVSVDLLSPRVSLDDEASSGVFDADGTALVIHATADDQRTDPSGNSGSRMACGVIARG